MKTLTSLALAVAVALGAPALGSAQDHSAQDHSARGEGAERERCVPARALEARAVRVERTNRHELMTAPQRDAFLRARFERRQAPRVEAARTAQPRRGARSPSHAAPR